MVASAPDPAHRSRCGQGSEFELMDSHIALGQSTFRKAWQTNLTRRDTVRHEPRPSLLPSSTRARSRAALLPGRRALGRSHTSGADADQRHRHFPQHGPAGDTVWHRARHLHRVQFRRLLPGGGDLPHIGRTHGFRRRLLLDCHDASTMNAQGGHCTQSAEPPTGTAARDASSEPSF